MITVGAKLTSMSMIMQAIAQGFALEVYAILKEEHDSEGYEVLSFGNAFFICVENRYDPYTMASIIKDPSSGRIYAVPMAAYDEFRRQLDEAEEAYLESYDQYEE